MKGFNNVIERVVVEGDKVKFGELVTFEAKDTKARVGRNPRNPEEEIDIPASRKVKCSVAKGFKDAVKA
jgi:DNA-binding protein HU-beta